MKSIKRMAAFILCMVMMIPNNLTYGASVSPEETLVAEEFYQDIEMDSEEAEEVQMIETESHYQETVSLLPIDPDEEMMENWSGEAVIYWNPGDGFQLDTALVASSANASASNAVYHHAAKGSDHADGLTPATPVQSLNTAIRRAEKLSRKMDLEVSDITVYAMNPMLISKDMMYTVRGRGVTIRAWEGRANQDDLLFAVDGGQLSLHNLILQPEDGGSDPAESPLVYIQSGKLQLGERVESYGSFILDYEADTQVWEWASATEAASNSSGNQYIEPVIELLKKFDAASEYVLDLRLGSGQEKVTAVQALYSDDQSTEEFLEAFEVVESWTDEWDVYVEEWIGGVLRDTTDEEEAAASAAEASSAEALAARAISGRAADISLTQKTLVASRAAGSGEEIYWNPGEAIDYEGEIYPAGDDINHDGTVPYYPVKTWAKAKEKAKGGTIICMQTIDLTEDNTNILGPLQNGSYVLDGDRASRVTLTTMEKSKTPVASVPDGITLTLRNLELDGAINYESGGNPNQLYSGAQLFLCEGGQLILEKNILNTLGYIQVSLLDTNQSKDHPIIVDSSDVIANVYFSGIHYNVARRYQDVVIAGANLLTMGEDAAGDLLLENISLEAINSILPSEGGISWFRWILRKDTGEDDGIVEPSHLELYTTYYFDAIYVDGIRGNDSDYGATCFLPVKTFAKALEILDAEMNRSIQARASAGSAEERDKIALPTRIYICDTITVTDQQTWTIPIYEDWDKKPIEVEIQTHTELHPDDSGMAPHEISKALVHVQGSNANLTLGDNILMRSIADQNNGYSIVVDEGAKLNLTKNARLTGLTTAGNEQSQTLGTHILAGKSHLTGTVTAGTVDLQSDWTGMIDSRAIGIEAFGSTSKVFFRAGEIRNHKNEDAAYAGVYLDGAVLEMSGGAIRDNAAYLRGAGVYLNNSARFLMTKGIIEKNIANTKGSTAAAEGAGVYLNSGTVFEMGTAGGNPTDCVIAEQISTGLYRGTGVFIGSNATFRMFSGTIRDNVGKGADGLSSNSYQSYGGGVYNSGYFYMSGGVISGNGANATYKAYNNLRGAGLYLAGTVQELTGGTIIGNKTGGYYSTSTTYTGGGGIYISRAATIKNMQITENRSYYGAGIATEGNYAIIVEDCEISNNLATYTVDDADASVFGYGGGIYSRSSLKGKNLTISGNKAYYGAGAYTSSYTSSLIQSQISGNIANSYGGGIYATSVLLLEDDTIEQNQGYQGAGIYNASTLYGVNTQIVQNIATNSGGGIYNTGVLYLSDKGTGSSMLSANQAIQGGGLYQAGGTVYLDIAGSIQNQASGGQPQGNNIYFTQTTTSYSYLYLLQGEFKQPDDSAQGVYNIYTNSNGSVIAELNMNPLTVTVSGADGIYLNTTNNYLRFLQAPAHNTFGTMPIDVNVDVFSIGSPIIKPGNRTTVTMYRPNAALTGGETYNITYPTALKDASIHVAYSDGGVIPERTQLGGFEDADNTGLINVVLVGEGVYLKSWRSDGKGGDDSNSGTGPEDAVATFARAKALLEERTDAKNALNGSGLSPFIYICGNVSVTSDETWKLDFTEDRYTTDSKYVVAEQAAGRVVEQAQIKRFTSYINDALITVKGSGTTLTIPMLIVDGMAESVITSDQGSRSPAVKVEAGSSLVLEDEAWIRNNYRNMIEVYGDLILNGAEGASNHQIDITRGDGVNLYAGSSMVMNGAARVIISKPFTDNSSISNYYYNQGYANRGVIIRQGSALTMNNQSQIIYTSNQATVLNSYTVGVLIGGSANNTQKAVLAMKDEAKIAQCYMGVGLESYNVDLQLYDQASLSGNRDGVYSYAKGRSDVVLQLHDEASIHNNLARGIYLSYQTSGVTTDAVTINLFDHSSVRDNASYGIQMYYMYPEIQITLQDQSRVVNNVSGGIVEASYAHNRSTIRMKDQSWLGAEGTGKQAYGIYYGTGPEFSGNKTDMYQIIMEDDALIGGDVGYNQEGSRKGNSSYGIYTNKPIQLTMSGNSKIGYNNGVGLYLGSNTSYTGTSKVTMQNQAEITNNSTYGIYSQEKLNGTVYYMDEIFTIKDQSKIQNNGYGCYFMNNSSVFLEDQVVIGAATGTGRDTITMNGSLYLDGTVTVTGPIRLSTGNKPLTLQSPVPSSGSVGKYELYITEGFVGAVVVRPDGTQVTDITPYQQSFKKTLGVGMAANKELVLQAPNLVLEGENNVYLSGMGDDNNSGITPTTAVRTFKRAKELLETGDFKDGANIIICNVVGKASNVPVQIIQGDEDWSFDENGLITNQNNGQSWKPAVIRDKDYFGVMLQLQKGSSTTSGHTSAQSVTLKNIIIDGLGDNATVASNTSAAKEMLKITAGAVTLGEGAVLRNNRRTMPSTSVTNNQEYTVMGVYVAASASLIIDGGNIENMALEQYRNTYLYKIGVGIYNLGTVELRDGTIDNNTYTQHPSYAYTMTAAAIVNDVSAVFTMSGGTIKNNHIQQINEANTTLSGGALAFVSSSTGVIKGGIISDNQGGVGSAIYYDSLSTLSLEGGRIRGNQPSYGKAIGIRAPIYVNSNQFQLKGGGIVLDDPIYLSSNKNLITITGNIYQTSRKYKVHLNQGTASNQFKKGSVVVQPDGQFLLDSSQFLVNFEAISSPYIMDRGSSSTLPAGTINGLVESQCLLLMQAVYLNSASGSDSNNGTTPKQAVERFSQAKHLGEGDDKTASNRDYYVIYLSGPAYHRGGEVWELPETAYLCRYTGFTIYQSDGTPSTEQQNAYYKYLIESDGELTLKNIRIYGRRVIDETSKNGDSILKLSNKSVITMLEGTILARNYNVGSFFNTQTGLLEALSMKGGAATVEIGGLLNIQGGTITATDATFGAAIYQDADTSDSNRGYGQVKLENSPLITNDIYLNGQIHRDQAYVEVAQNYKPLASDSTDGVLKIRLANDYHGRPIVKYPDGVNPTLDQVNYYQLDASITAIYDFDKNVTNNSILELHLRQILYVDSVGGNDSNTGANPRDAVKTIKGVYQRIFQLDADAGALVFVVNPLEIKSGENISLINAEFKHDGTMNYQGIYNDGVSKVEIDAQIYFKRYSQPDSTTVSGYDVATLYDSMFKIKKGGILTVNGIYIDGHSEESVSNADYLCAAGVAAKAPLITVEPGGTLRAGHISDDSPELQGGLGELQFTPTLFTNNLNVNEKTKLLGQNEQGDNVYEGSGSGIEILSDATDRGEARLDRVEFKKLMLGTGVNGGSDVYHNGKLVVLNRTIFSGTVLLEGVGSESNPASSRYIEVEEYGTPFKNNFNVIVRDPYNHRALVQYPSTSATGPQDRDLGYFLLEERVNRYYALQKRAGANHILELIVPTAVYVDGQNGSDTNGGWKPVDPVKTLRMAYSRLKENGGKVIYIVDTIEINSDIELSATAYESGNDKVSLLASNDHVDIRRYVRPVAGMSGMNQDPEYNRNDFNGTLIKIKDGGSLILKEYVYLDGHYQKKIDPEYTDEFRVEHTTEVIAPLLTVEHGGILRLLENSRLNDNHNTKALSGSETRVDGGAIYNAGSVELSGGVIAENAAAKGAGVYQNGTFEIIAGPAGIQDQQIYLATENSGNAANPVWGEDHTLDTGVLLSGTVKLNLQMDHAVAGRPVVKYTSHASVDAQYIHYGLGDTVPSSLFLVESEDNDSLLELQDWRVLDVDVPEEIFLVIQQMNDGTIRAADAADDELRMSSPEYTITNRGQYDAKVLLSGFVNQNSTAGISGHEVMNLVASASDALSQSAQQKDLYLAVKGTDHTGGFTDFGETSLFDYAVDNVTRKEMGVLAAGEEGNFMFIAAASERFINYYQDIEFPFFGSSVNAAMRKEHIRHKNSVTGQTSANYARAKYKMIYRIEIVPPRR